MRELERNAADTSLLEPACAGRPSIGRLDALVERRHRLAATGSAAWATDGSGS